MRKRRLANIGLVFVLVLAAGFYLEHGSRWLRTAFDGRSEEAELLKIHREPRTLPDVAFTDGDGRSVRLSTFRGKVILLNVWATWCPPCRKEMPALDRLESKLGGTDFQVIALSVDRDGLNAVGAFYRQAGITRLRKYVDTSGQVMSELAVSAIPTTLLIDRNGREIGRKVGPAAWDSPAYVDQLSYQTRNLN